MIASGVVVAVAALWLATSGALALLVGSGIHLADVQAEGSPVR